MNRKYIYKKERKKKKKNVIKRGGRRKVFISPRDYFERKVEQ